VVECVGVSVVCGCRAQGRNRSEASLVPYRLSCVFFVSSVGNLPCRVRRVVGAGRVLSRGQALDEVSDVLEGGHLVRLGHFVSRGRSSTVRRITPLSVVGLVYLTGQ